MKNIHFLYILMVFTITCKSRKYDIEQEAHKLYDESFSAVVHRFRRTPEYLSILQDQFMKMKNDFVIVHEKIKVLYLDKLEEAVLKELKVNLSINIMDQKRAKPHVSSVAGLDDYRMLHSALSLAERNRMRDIAYEYNGKMIHDLMQRWLPDDSDKSSTKQPDGGYQQEKTTTEHIHVVTTITTSEEPEHDTIATSTSGPHHHQHQSTAGLESQRHFRIPNKLNKNK